MKYKRERPVLSLTFSSSLKDHKQVLLCFYFRCLLLWPLHHHHLCQRRSSGDGTPDASFSDDVQAELHGSGLPVPAAVHQRAQSLQRQPLPGGVGSQVLPLQRRSAQLLLSHLHSGRAAERLKCMCNEARISMACQCCRWS